MARSFEELEKNEDGHYMSLRTGRIFKKASEGLELHCAHNGDNDLNERIYAKIRALRRDTEGAPNKKYNAFHITQHYKYDALSFGCKITYFRPIRI